MTQTTIDRLFAQWDKPDSPGCALAVIRDGQIIYERGYGQATLEYDAPITPGTIFHVASVSKQFTAFATALLAQEGKLSLDDDVRQYVPELPPFGATITPRHLIHHTSGLRDQWGLVVAAGWRMSDVITTSDILELVQHQQDLNFAPGAEYSYCNTGYTLLAQIVERVSGMPFRNFCAQRIFQPLGMHNTHFHDDCEHVVKNRAYSYFLANDGHFHNAVLSYSNAGGTSLFTTVEDLAHWDQNFYDAKVGGQALIDQMHTRGKLNDGTMLSYAFGLSIGEYRGLRIVEHAGGDAGFRCMLTRFPAQHCTVVVLGNVADMDTGKLARQVADVYLEREFKGSAATPPPATATAENPSTRAGTYFAPETTEILLLEARDGKLILTGSPDLELIALEPGRYKPANDPTIEYRFYTVDGRSQVHKLRSTGQPIVYHAMPAVHLSEDQLTEYAGQYYSPELSVVYSVRVHEGQLLLQRRKYGAAPLRPAFADAFKCATSSGNFDVLFHRRDDWVSGCQISTGSLRNMRFVRLGSV
jgi:CubicO group peptidase (beta-lactamase class C family)